MPMSTFVIFFLGYGLSTISMMLGWKRPILVRILLCAPTIAYAGIFVAFVDHGFGRPFDPPAMLFFAGMWLSLGWATTKYEVIGKG